MNLEQRKKEIAERMASEKEPKSKHELVNMKNRAEGLKIVARDRHERRHQGKKGTSLEERHSFMKLASKDYGIKS